MKTETTPNSAPPAPAQRPEEFLRALFLERKSRNPSYSTRAFARDLGMSQALVSYVMNGKRPLTMKQAAQISVLLGFSQERTQEFLESALLALPAGTTQAARKLRNAQTQLQKQREDLRQKKPIFVDYEIERFKALSHWYHVAILDLCAVKGFKDDARWIARKLGISTIEARDAVERLITLSLLERDATTGRARKTGNKIYFATQRSETAVRSFHKQMIGKALAQLERTDAAAFTAREISAVTMSIPRSRLEQARQRIQAFQKELCAELTASGSDAGDGAECDEVYQLNVQLFPLTVSEPNPASESPSPKKKESKS